MLISVRKKISVLCTELHRRFELNSCSLGDGGMLGILFGSYIIFFFIMFFSKDLNHAGVFFKYFVTPAALAPFRISFSELFTFKLNKAIKISFSHPIALFRMGRSLLFLSVLVFVFAIALSTWLHPVPQLGWFWIMEDFSLSTFLFLLITARLSADVEKFYSLFFDIIVFAAAVSALVNLYFHINLVIDPSLIFARRLDASFSGVPAAGATAIAMFYGFYSVVAFIRATEASSIIGRIIFSAATLVLFFIVILTQSRGSAGAALIVSGAYFVYYFRLWRLRGLPAIGLILLSVIAIFKFIAAALQRGAGQRGEVWSSFFNLIRSKPVFGYGERIEFWVKNSFGDHLGHAHNLLLSAAVRGGILAFLALLSVFILSYRKAIKLFLVFGTATPLALLAFVTITGSVDFDLLVMPPNWQWATIWLSIGLCMGADKALVESDWYLRRPQKTY